MKNLKFTPELCKKILDGSKTSTWRFFDDNDLQTGDEVTFLNKESLEEIGTAILTDVKVRTLGTLTDADWDGHERFPSEEKMYETYRGYYGDKVDENSDVKIIKFKFTKSGENREDLENYVDTDLREISEEDVDQVFSLISVCSKWLEKQGMTHWSEYYDREKVTQLIKEKKGFALVKDGSIVSVAFMSDVPPDYYKDNEQGVNYVDSFTEPGVRAYYGFALAVHPDYQGKGYAKYQMRNIEQIAKRENVKYVRFDARGDFEFLVSFYKRLGYKIVGEMPDPDSVYYLFEKELG